MEKLSTPEEGLSTPEKGSVGTKSANEEQGQSASGRAPTKMYSFPNVTPVKVNTQEKLEKKCAKTEEPKLIRNDLNFI